MKVLAVEDDNITRTVLEASLASLGHEVVTAVDGCAAWEVLSRESIRVVVSDWAMPRMNGLELCSRIRGRTGEDYVYFILLTKTCASESNQECAHEAGVDDFLVKPINQRDLRLRLGVAERIVSCLTHVTSAPQG